MDKNLSKLWETQGNLVCVLQFMSHKESDTA